MLSGMILSLVLLRYERLKSSISPILCLLRHALIKMLVKYESYVDMLDFVYAKIVI